MPTTGFFVPVSCSRIRTNDPVSNRNDKNHEHKPLADSAHHLNSAIKVPTAPWMKGPLLLQSYELQNLPNQLGNVKLLRGHLGEEKRDLSLAGKEGGVRGSKALKKIVRSIDELERKQISGAKEEDCDVGGSEGYEKKKKLMPWERKKEQVVLPALKEVKVKTIVRLNIDEELLYRLRDEARRMRKWVKVKKAGITQDVVDQIKLAWKQNELVMVKFDIPLCRSMSRARDILEMKTKGLVIWTRKDVHVIYNSSGASFTRNKATGENANQDDAIEQEKCQLYPSLFERETNRLLNGLGPSFEDWWMQKPLPVDADMLPEVVDGFKSPQRLSPPYDCPKLTDDELTYLRKYARSLPIHFVLGRNRKLQGLADAILKLWKKCAVAKIAIKWGVPATDNEQMAKELKLLTGGTLLLRNKFYIILYRGTDFIVDKVANLIQGREFLLNNSHINEENARLQAVELLSFAERTTGNSFNLGTLSEFKCLQAKYSDSAMGIVNDAIGVLAQIESLEKKLRIEGHKYSLIKRKIENTERELSELNSGWEPAEPDPDCEMMTEEQRECFRNIGLKMKSSLVLGRRGVFDGVMEGLHQHWKHKEVVKVITMQKLFSQVMDSAELLEAESGGIVVSIEKLKDGHAIIIYRGKNYRRPMVISRGSLLTKRVALKRSLLLQRIGSLKFYANQRHNAILDIKSELTEVQRQRQSQNEPDVP